MTEALPMLPDQGDTILTIDELSRYLKISKSTLYKLAQEGSLPGQKIGKHWRFHRDAVDHWLKETFITNRRSKGPGGHGRIKRIVLGPTPQTLAEE